MIGRSRERSIGMGGSTQPRQKTPVRNAIAWLGFESTVLVVAMILLTALAGAQPNLVFIMTDDQGVDAIEGDPWSNDLGVHTPNLATLAENGRSFINVRVNPYCSPTRTAMMTGRDAFSTGVTHVINRIHPLPDRDLLSLQTHERTIGDVLQARGYHTIFIDKWHMGWDDPALMPEGQGFDVSFLWPDYINLDDPEQTGDEHTTRMVDLAIDAVQSRPDPNAPYALFFWSIDAHSRGGLEDFAWWRVGENLLPSGENYYHHRNDSNRNRYRAVVEALDTEIGRLLRTLNIMDSNGRYRAQSETVVIVTSDNGTPREVADVPNHAKGSLFDGGVHVPLIVFGENVPSDGAVLDRLIGHVDFYETVADLAGADESLRGTVPRSGMSFADDIGWSGEPLPRRAFTFSSLGHPDLPREHLFAVTNGRHKLIVRAGGLRLAPLAADQFYDLADDPAENDNLINEGMTGEQEAVYLHMRTVAAAAWPSAVSEATELNVDLAMTDSLALNSRDESLSPLPIGFSDLSRGGSAETRVFLKFDIDALERQLPPDATVDDIEYAEVLVAFRSDSRESGETDTGPIRAYPMSTDWTRGRIRWRDLENAYEPAEVGQIDLAPHIIPDPEGDRLSGVPLEYGTPVSWGPNETLADWVRQWHREPDTNHGVVLIADPLPGLRGDQRVTFLDIAGLRLTLRQGR